ncbi:nuclear factor interleukin-3-regulated protein-like [Chanos chanos]|uniref:Nuclear factor interleukin-3-regulated protein-like n=1 Tax=Chanos chanos TaxID=29144 RepID=A0A6J2W561_CHACN|nr:nuclear factor interleukin-3-regulated protein-like [Chanos chanos]
MEVPFAFLRQEVEGEFEETALRGSGSRRKREFIPDEKKDATYWEKRRKNNEAAKRSREKRRVNDYVLETRLVALSEENARLHTELLALKLRFGLLGSVTHSTHPRTILPLHPCASQPFPGASNPGVDRELHWNRRQGVRDPHPLPSFSRPSSLNTHPGSAFLPTRSSLSISRGYPYYLDVQGILPTTNTPVLLPPLVPPPSAAWAGLPLLPPARQRFTVSDEEGEQQVPATSGTDASAALPHKLRLKTHRPRPQGDSAAMATSPLPVYVSD